MVAGDSASALVTAIASLIGALVWPAVLVIVVLRFRKPIADFLSNLGEFSVKTPGLEATARRQIEAAAALGAATAIQADTRPENGNKPPDPRTVADVLPDARKQRRIADSLILWVDDRPENNHFERQALEALGVRIEVSTSTEDALQRVQQRHYDLIISDMGRAQDDRAGYTLLDQLRAEGNQIPFVIYAGSRAPHHVAEARRHGAIGCTNQPQELISMVTNALASAR